MYLFVFSLNTGLQRREWAWSDDCRDQGYRPIGGIRSSAYSAFASIVPNCSIAMPRQLYAW